jgi:solute carrier family 25 carnitine/acylcarnitine transporter 20/29
MSREFGVDAAAGWISGAASVVASQPIDTVLTRLQLAPPSVRPASLFDELRREGGLRSLWRGTSPLTWVIPFQNALLFAGYGMGERAAKYLQSERAAATGGADAGPSSLVPIFVGGVFGGVAQSFIVSPAELVKVHMQAEHGMRPALGLVGGASQAYSTLGTAALWRGLGATLLRDGLPHGVWFASYEAAKRALAERARAAGAAGTPVPADAVALTSGAFAAVVAWSVGYPADIIKTRIQMPRPPTAPPPTIARVAAELLAEHGGQPLRAFYRGFGLKLLRAVPMNALSFVVYERARAAVEVAWPNPVE